VNSALRRSPFSPLAALLLVCVGLLAFAGCASYRLGAGARPGFTTLYIAPVKNTASVPQAAAIVSARLREAFLRDGRVALAASPEAADAVLTVSLGDYRRETLTTRVADTGLARKFGLTLTAGATLSDRRAGRELFTARPLRAERQAFTDSGQLLAEYDAVPLLADELAAAAVRAVLDTW
jgi:hypothetical protein